MRMNANMERIRRGRPVPDLDLGQFEDIADVVDRGWHIGPHGAFLLAAHVEHGRSGGDEAAQLGLVEYDVNDVHVSLADLAAPANVADYLAIASDRGLALAVQMLRKAAALPGSDRLFAAVSMWVDKADDDFDMQGVVVRFFSERGAFPDWFTDLDKFELQAIAIVGPAGSLEPQPIGRPDGRS